MTLAEGRSARAIRVDRDEDLPAAAQELGLPRRRETIVLVGGADLMSEAELRTVEPLFSRVIAPLVETRGRVAIDGGTDSGVMALMGAARARIGASFPLVGVVVDDVALVPGEAKAPEAAPLQPEHTHFVLVPGSSFGDEVPWLARLGTVISDGAGSVTVLVNGGEFTWADAEQSVAESRPILAVEGSGRVADALAAGTRGEAEDERARALAASGLVHAASLDEPAALAELVDRLLVQGGS